MTSDRPLSPMADLKGRAVSPKSAVPLASEPDALLDRVQGAIADVHAAGGTVGHVSVAFTEDDWDAVANHNVSFSAVAASKAMHHEHDSTQIHEAISPEDGDVVVRKIRYGAASTSDLHEQLAALAATTASTSCPTAWPTVPRRSTGCSSISYGGRPCVLPHWE